MIMMEMAMMTIMRLKMMMLMMMMIINENEPEMLNLTISKIEKSNQQHPCQDHARCSLNLQSLGASMDRVCS